MQLDQAARGGVAPADISMMAQVTRLKGQSAKLWAPLDESKLTNTKNLYDHFVARYDDQKIAALGAVSWYITLVTNTKVYPTPPNSWKELWNPANKGKIGLLALASNSFLLEITSKTWFGGTDLLGSQEGIEKALAKLAEVKPNVALWYRDEGQFQQALQAGEIPMGQYYHDVTGLAASQGQPVRSTFPQEGGVLDSGSWCVSKASKALDAAHAFINYMAEVREQVGGGPVYISFDIDGLDPSYAGGTGTPEIAGLTTPQAVEIIRGCRGLDIIGGDLVEVSPPYDPSGNTALTAANLLFEMLCVFPGVQYRA